MVDPDRVRCAIRTTYPERRAERCPTLTGPYTKGQDSGGGPTFPGVPLLGVKPVPTGRAHSLEPPHGGSPEPDS